MIKTLLLLCASALGMAQDLVPVERTLPSGDTLRFAVENISSEKQLEQSGLSLHEGKLWLGSLRTPPNSVLREGSITLRGEKISLDVQGLADPWLKVEEFEISDVKLSKHLYLDGSLEFAELSVAFLKGGALDYTVTWLIAAGQSLRTSIEPCGDNYPIWVRPVWAYGLGEVLADRAGCIIVDAQDGKEITRRSGRGISPLLSMHDEDLAKMEGAILCDKVIGRGAAFLAVAGKVSHVHARMMSQDAYTLLLKHGIGASYEIIVPRILNRNKDGFCPMETAVEGIDDVPTAIQAIRDGLIKLRQNGGVAPASPTPLELSPKPVSPSLAP